MGRDASILRRGAWGDKRPPGADIAAAARRGASRTELDQPTIQARACQPQQPGRLALVVLARRMVRTISSFSTRSRNSPQHDRLVGTGRMRAGIGRPQNLAWQIAGRDLSAGGALVGLSNHVGQLVDVARPGVGRQPVERVAGNPADLLGGFALASSRKACAKSGRSSGRVASGGSSMVTVASP